MPIIDRTINTLIKVSAWSALYRMYLHSQTGGYGFQFVGLPDDYEPESSQPYDPDEMQKMFDIGYEMGRLGTGWRSTPPGSLIEESGPVFASGHLPKLNRLVAELRMSAFGRNRTVTLDRLGQYHWLTLGRVGFNLTLISLILSPNPNPIPKPSHPALIRYRFSRTRSLAVSKGCERLDRTINTGWNNRASHRKVWGSIICEERPTNT